MQYFGAAISSTGDVEHELNQRIGAAKQEFKTLRKLWSHSFLTWPCKLNMFATLIESKLLCSLSGACLSKVQLRRLDGFQNRCEVHRWHQAVFPFSCFKRRSLETRKAHTWPSVSIAKSTAVVWESAACSKRASSEACFLCPVVAWSFGGSLRFVRSVGRPAKEFIQPFHYQVFT